MRYFSIWIGSRTSHEVPAAGRGLAAKVRPALVLSVSAGESERALVTLVAHTTSLRNSRFEVPLSVQFLRPGAFDAQSLVTIPHVKLIRRLGNLAPQQLTQVEARVCEWLGLLAAS